MKDPPQLTDPPKKLPCPPQILPPPVATDASKCDPQHLSTCDKKDAEDRMSALLQVRKKFEEEIATLKKEIKVAPAEVHKLRKARKVSESSLYSKCEQIFKEHNVVRGVVIMAEISMEC